MIMLIITSVGNINITKLWEIWNANDEYELKLMRNWIKTNAVKLNNIKSHKGDYFNYFN